jgi:hypothetical protein
MLRRASILIAVLGVMSFGAANAQPQPSSNPNSTFWSEGFSARSVMADPLTANPLASRGPTSRLVRMPVELGSMDQPNVLIAPGVQPLRVATGSKSRGDIIATIPFRFRELGRLTQNVRAGVDGSGPVLVPAGSLGYGVGPSQIENGRDHLGAWCFILGSGTALTPPADGSRFQCLFALNRGGWTIAPIQSGFTNILMAPRSKRPNIMAPVVEPMPILAGPEHTLELRLESWTRQGVFFKTYVNGQFVEVIGMASNSPTAAKLELVGQTLTFTRTAGGGSIATVTTNAP